MKKLILTAVIASAMFACNSNPSDQIVGTWIPKDAKKDKVSNDTLFIEKIEGDRYNLRAHYWAGEEKRAINKEVVFKENTLYLPNNKFFTFTESEEFDIDGVLYKNLE